ncbi:MAG: DNA-directed RNA polymerase [Candidatus Woesearchaeota archaeon]|nr:MAG: DNA-directed RNA polymerase [Candidatus Woesearchaeota archaeon]
MRDFNRGGSRGGGGFKRDFGSQQKYDAVCSACGKDCKVPFQPKEGREVFCQDCYRNKKKAA